MKPIIKNTPDFHPGLGYDYKFGVFYRMKKVADKLVIAHILVPNDEGMLQYFCACTNKNKKIRPLRAAYEIFNEKLIGHNELVYPKDLDVNNFKADNVGIIDKDVFRKLKDALYNVEHGVSVSVKPNRPYTYVVQWKENGRFRTKTVHDMVGVYRLKRIIMWKSCKLVSKYTVTT